jgi:4-hydroxy-2-oxoglutarate aldolase
VLALSAIVPDLCVRLYELVRQGCHEDARALQRRLVPLARLIGPVHGIAGLKAALDLAGFTGGSPRAPLLPLGPEGRREIQEALAAVHP